ncbi:glycosyltransferase [Butyrivibrio sp. MB2005]|uniref:glycosyltransferase n=1 Tax=Butyrivibrio sp. MB2005 TaxID=1280678 RepID=UPI0003F92176|nr:glycosyltransferase [Butyrivibrio sp. MB2005]
MIFVTVGTHEQPFNRLVEYMDNWAKDHDEEVIIQSGFSTYEPKYATWQKLFPFQEMNEKIEKARIVITHGGPSSFIAPLQIGKIPIVVPRMKAYNEHVNDHQLLFCRIINERIKNIILVEDEQQLDEIIENYNSYVDANTVKQKSHNEVFIEAFEKNIKELVD